MTENEAKEMLATHYEFLRESWKPYPDRKVLDAIKIAISSIDKIQQYRAIGTVEAITEVVKFLSPFGDDTIIGDMDTLYKYKRIGTVEECREAMEKQKAMEAKEILLHNGRKGFECKSCGNKLSTNVFESAYCHWCGQKLDLGDVD